MARYIYISRDWQREDDIMQCDACKALIYSEYMHGHTTLCGVEVEETGQEAKGTGRSIEAERVEEDDPAIESPSKTTKEAHAPTGREDYPITRRSGRCHDCGDCKKTSKEQAKETLSLFNMQ